MIQSTDLMPNYNKLHEKDKRLKNNPMFKIVTFIKSKLKLIIISLLRKIFQKNYQMPKTNVVDYKNKSIYFKKRIEK
jgi:hypothetical protein